MDPKALALRFEGEAYEPSRRFRKLLLEEPFDGAIPVEPKEHRSRITEQLTWFAKHGYGRLGLPPSLGGDPFQFNCLVHELGLYDLSLMMGFGLQFGFVMRAVSRLGTKDHHPWLEKIGSLEARACLAMTETAHGSAVKRLQTEAVYQPESRHFLLTTPHREARKDYVCSALTSELALVFARLISMDKDYGIHAFLVPLTDRNGNIREGIEVEECPPMGGLTGLDYGRLSFQEVVVPAENLLGKHGEVERDGTYGLHLKSESHRFNALISSLVVGRSLVTAGATAGAKTSLIIATRYANERRQFKSPDQSEENPILTYQAVQKRLMPALATLFALEAGRSRLAQTQHEYFEDSKQDRELETFTGALKAYASAFSLKVVQECRQSCGGAGALVQNRLVLLRRDLDMFPTSEGDNTILELMVARSLLLDFDRGLDRSKTLKLLDWVVKGVSYAAQVNPLKSKGASAQDLVDQVFLAKALRFRLDRLRYSLAGRVRSGLAEKQELFHILNECQEHSIALSRAYCEEKIFRYLRNTKEACPPGWDHRTLERILVLFGLARIEADKGWFLERNYLSGRQTRMIRDQVLELSAKLAAESSMILDSFEVPPQILSCPLVDGS